MYIKQNTGGFHHEKSSTYSSIISTCSAVVRHDCAVNGISCLTPRNYHNIGNSEVDTDFWGERDALQEEDFERSVEEAAEICVWEWIRERQERDAQKQNDRNVGASSNFTLSPSGNFHNIAVGSSRTFSGNRPMQMSVAAGPGVTFSGNGSASVTISVPSNARVGNTTAIEVFPNNYCPRDNPNSTWLAITFTAPPVTMRTITWNAAGGTVNGSSTWSSSHAQGSVIGSIPTPSRWGYSFNGWRNASGSSIYWDTIMPNSNMTATAQWSWIHLPPGQVSNIRITSATHEGALVSWNAPTSGGVASHYTIRLNYASNGAYARSFNAGGATSMFVSGLRPETVYIVQIIAHGGGGDSWTWSNANLVTTPIPRPSSVIISRATPSEIFIGQTAAFNVRLEPGNTPFVTTQWRSSNTAVATINNNGVLSARNPGTTQIHAVVNGVQSNILTIIVLDNLVHTHVNLPIPDIEIGFVGVIDFMPAGITVWLELFSGTIYEQIGPPSNPAYTRILAQQVSIGMNIRGGTHMDRPSVAVFMTGFTIECLVSGQRLRFNADALSNFTPVSPSRNTQGFHYYYSRGIYTFPTTNPPLLNIPPDFVRIGVHNRIEVTPPGHLAFARPLQQFNNIGYRLPRLS